MGSGPTQRRAWESRCDERDCVLRRSGGVVAATTMTTPTHDLPTHSEPLASSPSRRRNPHPSLVWTSSKPTNSHQSTDGHCALLVGADGPFRTLLGLGGLAAPHGEAIVSANHRRVTVPTLFSRSDRPAS